MDMMVRLSVNKQQTEHAAPRVKWEIPFSPTVVTSDADTLPPPENQEAETTTRTPATLRLPPFSATEPELWLLQVQFAFDADLARFRILAANLPMEVARDVKDQLVSN